MEGSVYRIPFVILLLAFGALLHSQDSPGKSPDAVVGKWIGKVEALPAVELEVKRDGDNFSGTVVMYSIMDDGSGPKVKDRIELPMIDPKFDGQKLAFGFVRKEDGARMKALLRLVAADEGRFEYGGSGESLPMKREH
jgi:hypothetical protein